MVCHQAYLWQSRCRPRKRNASIRYIKVYNETDFLKERLLRFNYNNTQYEIRFGAGPTNAVLTLMGICIVLFAIFSFNKSAVGSILGFTPGRLMPWQFVTANFLHSSFNHLLFNMLGLFMFGCAVEKALKGRGFLVYYAVCGIGSFLFTYLLYLIGILPNGIYVGASGALYGLLVAYSLLFPKEKMLLFFVIPMQAKWAALIFGGMEFLLVFRNDGINHFGHIGGAAAGVGYFVYIRGIVFVKTALNS